jgi:hypothetical protein
MILVDIDGTVADHKHREALLTPTLKLEECEPCEFFKDESCLRAASCKSKIIDQGQWDAFFDHDLMMKDGVVRFSREVLEQARLYHDIIFLTGRNERTRNTTTVWLRDVFKFDHNISLYMRESDDHRPAPEFKGDKIASIKLAHANEATNLFAFDDDLGMKKIYKGHGFKIFSAPGCWEFIYETMGLFT